MNEQLKNYLAGVPESSKDDANESAPSATIKQSYARDETITKVSGRLRGCWSDSMSGACEETKYTSIQLSAIVFNQYAGDCDTGKAITAITYN